MSDHSAPSEGPDAGTLTTGAERRGARRHVDPVKGALSGCALITALFLLAPLIVVFINSVGVEQYVIFPPSGFSLHWYSVIPQYYIDGAILSLTVAAAAIVTSSLLAIPAALAIARGSLPGRGVIDAVLRSPVQIPLLISGVAFLQFYVVLQAGLGLTLQGTFVGLWIAHTMVVSPYVLIAVVARLARYPESLDEAAYGLGASRARTFFDVTLPIISPAIASGTFFAFLMSFDNVPTTIFLIQSGQTTLPLALFFDTELALSRIQYAVGTVVTILSTALILFAMRKFDLLPSISARRRAG